MHFVIVGSGITALSTAWSLVNRGQTVSLIDKERIGNASSAAGGMLSPSCESDGCEPDLIQLSIESCRQYPEWIAEIESVSNIACGYEQCGTLLVALHHDHNQELEHLLGFQKQYDLPHEWLSRKQLKRTSPNLARHIGGLFFESDHYVNPRKLCRSLREALSIKGAQFINGSCTWGAQDDQTVKVQVNETPIQADHIIVADGAWSMKHFPTLPLRPVKGQFLLLAPKEGSVPVIEHVIRTPDVYIIPRDNGQLYIGATMEEEGFDTRQTAGATLDLLYHAFQVLPGVYEMVVVEQGTGFRPALRDNQPLIGMSTIENLWFNVGHYRHGIMLAPAAANLLTNALLEGKSVPHSFSSVRYPEI